MFVGAQASYLKHKVAMQLTRTAQYYRVTRSLLYAGATNADD